MSSISIPAITLKKPSSQISNRYPKPPKTFFSQNQLLRCSSSSLSSPSPSMSMQTNFDLKTYWTSLIIEINQKLDEAVPIKYPEQIYKAMRYSVLAPGAKRAAPIMCIASCELFGGSRLAAYPTACALEMVHEASLIHDDLPYMDDDLFRRERLSNHAIYGVDMAILAGDALFPLGFQHIVSHTPPSLVPEKRLLHVITEIARSVGSTGMAAGQFLDLVNGEEASVEFVQEKKFGELSECSAVCGGLLGGATDDEIQSLRRYGRTVGVLYQVIEDVLKMKGDEKEEVGKKGKSSFAKAFGVEKALEKAEELRAKAKRELDGFEKYGERVQPLVSFVDYAVDRSFAIGDHVENGAVGANQGPRWSRTSKYNSYGRIPPHPSPIQIGVQVKVKFGKAYTKIGLRTKIQKRNQATFVTESLRKSARSQAYKAESQIHKVGRGTRLPKKKPRLKVGELLPNFYSSIVTSCTSYSQVE